MPVYFVSTAHSCILFIIYQLTLFNWLYYCKICDKHHCYIIFQWQYFLSSFNRLFVLPMRDSLFSAIGLLLRRKDDYFEKDVKGESRKNKEESTRKHSNATVSSISGKHSAESLKKYKKECGNNRPFIYVCGTMWHETNTEMLQLLKSLFR